MKEGCELLEKAYDYASRRNIVSQPVIEAYVAGYNSGDDAMHLLNRFEKLLEKDYQKEKVYNGVSEEGLNRFNIIKARLGALKNAISH